MSFQRVLIALAVTSGWLLCDLPRVESGEVGIRIRFGLNDTEPTNWDGTITVQPGRVSHIAGWRFEQGDRANGVSGWTASTRSPIVVGRTNAQKGKAKANAAPQPKPEGKPQAKPDAKPQAKLESKPQAQPQAKPDADTQAKPQGKPDASGKAANEKGAKKGNAKVKAAATPAGTMADNGVLVTLKDVTEDSVVTVRTMVGEFRVSLSEIPYGKWVTRLDGAVEVERTAASATLTSGTAADDDYPSAAVAPDGTVYVVYSSFTPGLDRDERSRSWSEAPPDLKFLAKAPGGDQLWLKRVQPDGATLSQTVTASGSDIYRSAVTVAGDGTVWIIWSENKKYRPFPDNPTSNFEIWARPCRDGKLGEPMRLSSSDEPDIWPVATTDAAGRVWVAWQGARQGVFRILARHQVEGGWSDEWTVSTQRGNCWAPALASSSAPVPRVAIAWDTYDKGDYDVWVREFDASGRPEAPRPVTSTADYEARPSITYDRQGRLWVAWEQSGPTWGKDWGALVQRKGIGLYKDRQIGVAVLSEGQWKEPVELAARGLPGAQPRRRVNNQRVPAIEPQAESRVAGQEAEAQRNLPHNNIARMVCDRDGRVWLFARCRHNDFRSQIGSLWLTHATYYDGQRWVGPILVPHSDNLLYNSPAVVALPEGAILVAHSSDHRQDRHVARRGANALGILDGKDPFENDLYLSRLELPSGSVAPQLMEAKVVPKADVAPSDATRQERADVARLRAYRADVGGESLRIVRGEFHRHTEISGDGGNDGPLEDMWRYAIDVAQMDWLGCGDHDNGGHREYPWWLTQKTTDAFHLPSVFEPLFTYERSVRYPEGHRNVVFTRRGIRTLPRLPITDRNVEMHAPDTQLLYRYLKQFDGVCASHTSATSMGTDWRDHDPAVEPMVEIYQGARQNYERPGAPRSPTADDAIGGWEPKGFVNLALLKGHKFSFQASSDHGSTHISYALVYSTGLSRAEILQAMKRRHTYAATDNIIADFRCRSGDVEHMMGDEFTVTSPPTLRIKLIGTAPLAKVTLVKQDAEIPLEFERKAEVEIAWTDSEARPGTTSYYYVRGEQEDGELVWASPMWITYKPVR